MKSKKKKFYSKTKYVTDSADYALICADPNNTCKFDIEVMTMVFFNDQRYEMGEFFNSKEAKVLYEKYVAELEAKGIMNGEEYKKTRDFYKKMGYDYSTNPPTEYCVAGCRANDIYSLLLTNRVENYGFTSALSPINKK